MQKSDSPTLLGVRASIWKVIVVVASAAIGALISGQVYGDYTVAGAIAGLFLGESLVSSKRKFSRAEG